MSRCVVYQSGGFTNYGISYRKYSQEELAEMENRAMTENEKAINILEHMKNLVTVRIFEEEALDRAIKALEEVQQYRAIGTPEECRAAMEKQPVFNMDKVVEQLKALTGEECTLHECGIRSEHCKACIAKKAIDIVKAGGVDGN